MSSRFTPSGLRLLLAFVAGALAVLIFHQGMLALLHGAGMTKVGAWSMQPLPPFGVPAVVSAAFWGGIWGLFVLLCLPRLPRGRGYWLALIVFGAVLPSVVYWIVVLPLKGQPMGLGWPASLIALSLLVNGAWGFGTAIFLHLFGLRAQRAPRRLFR